MIIVQLWKKIILKAYVKNRVFEKFWDFSISLNFGRFWQNFGDFAKNADLAISLFFKTPQLFVRMSWILRSNVNSKVREYTLYNFGKRLFWRPVWKFEILKILRFFDFLEFWPILTKFLRFCQEWRFGHFPHFQNAMTFCQNELNLAQQSELKR